MMAALEGVRRNRLAARVLVIDRDDRLLLFHFTPGDRKPYWATAGGEVDPGEDFPAAARRELLEETGFSADVHGPFTHRETDFTTFSGEPVHAVEQYFAARVAGGPINDDGHTDGERSYMVSHRWWSIEEFVAESPRVYPPDIVDLWREAVALVPQGETVTGGQP